MMLSIRFKVIHAFLFFKWFNPRYKLNGINFENHLPLLHVSDRKNRNYFLLLSAREVLARTNMIEKFSEEDISRICYCLSQEYYLLDKQQLVAMQDTLS